VPLGIVMLLMGRSRLPSVLRRNTAPSSAHSETKGSNMKPAQKRPLESTAPSLPRYFSCLLALISSWDQTFLIQRYSPVCLLAIPKPYLPANANSLGLPSMSAVQLLIVSRFIQLS
jgi:hypothetical protein